ncbi:unnamed protein product [Leptidea sinapis]|uniref:Uncharacterized protein n=1 Tax=Leptidea sinapis TaxID=189913 RepID=A0A5E4Q9D9_9NEOP|nr:unnamed protein product [Leptidea sinapis]
MDTLYHQTSQLILDTSALFYKLENEPNAEAIENEIQARIKQINMNCERLDVLVFKTPINQRPMAKMRVDQLKYDNKHIQASLTNAQNKRRRREQEKEEREQLLSRRFGNDHTAITVDYMAQESVANRECLYSTPDM